MKSHAFAEQIDTSITQSPSYKFPLAHIPTYTRLLVAPAPRPFAFFVPAAFLPGFPSTSPTSFSAAPATLSFTFSVGVRFFLTILVLGPAVAVVVLGLVTRPVVVRGLDVLAVVVARFLGVITSSTCCKRRGLLLPVLARVEAGMLAGRVGSCLYGCGELGGFANRERYSEM